jgi:hypothetical protein
MSSGRQASLAPTDTSAATLYTCPSGKVLVGTLRACNNSGDDGTVSVWLSHGSPDDADLIEPETALLDAQVLENSGLVMGSGDILTVQCSQEGINFVLWGLEEAA